MEDKEIAELHKLMDMYRESVERLYNAIEIAAMRQLAEHWHLQKGDRTGFQDAKRLISRMRPWKWHVMTGPDLRQG